MINLPPHIGAVVGSPALARVATSMLAKAPRQVDVALPVIVPEGAPLPSVTLLVPWSTPFDAGGRRVRVAALARSVASTLAARFAATTASQLCRDTPAGCTWALYLDGVNVAVVCVRLAAASAPTTPEAV